MAPAAPRGKVYRPNPKKSSANALGACCARHEFERRRSRLSAHHGADVGCGVAAVLGAVRGIDLVADVVVCLHNIREGDVFLDAAGPDATLVAYLRAAVPCGSAPTPGSHVQVVAH